MKITKSRYMPESCQSGDCRRLFGTSGKCLCGQEPPSPPPPHPAPTPSSSSFWGVMVTQRALEKKEMKIDDKGKWSTMFDVTLYSEYGETKGLTGLVGSRLTLTADRDGMLLWYFSYNLHGLSTHCSTTLGLSKANQHHEQQRIPWVVNHNIRHNTRNR